MLTSVIDLLFLMVIALLTIGVLVSAVQPAVDAPDAALVPGSEQLREGSAGGAIAIEELIGEHDSLLKKRDDLASSAPSEEGVERQREMTEATRSELKLSQDEKIAVEESVRELQARVDEKEMAAKEASKEVTTLDDLEEIAKNRRKQNAELEEDLERERIRWVSLQAQAARKANKPRIVVKGVVWEKRDPAVKQVYYVLLSKGRVFPLEESGFVKETRYSDGVVKEAVGAGLTPEDVLKPRSIVMRSIDVPLFRATGKVVFVVNPDSFATFRVLRDHLKSRGIRVAWSPFEGTEVSFGSGGRNPGDQ